MSFVIRLSLMVWLVASFARADTVGVAVAANFRAPVQALAAAFHAETGHTLSISAGSTGQLYAQIVQGAPYDVFLAADQTRPQALVKAGLAVDQAPLTYAEGQLFLLTRPDAGATIPAVLHGARRISIANPRTAPYGLAAMQVLEKLGISDARLAYAQSVSGVNAAMKAGAVDAGFAALSSTIAAPAHGMAIPRDWHDPIRQDAVLLTRARGEAPGAFLTWLGSDTARTIIRDFGYHVD